MLITPTINAGRRKSTGLFVLIHSEKGQIFETSDLEAFKARCKEEVKKHRRAKTRKEREDALKSLGLTKVKGNLGGTYWE